MLIGIDASRAARAERTGTENYAYHLIRHILSRSSPHRFRLYLQQPPPVGLFDSEAETKVISVPRLWTHLGLGVEMLRHAPDVLFVPAHVLPLVHPKQSVVTIHDLGYHYFSDAHTASQRAYLDWSTRYAVRNASRLIAVSRATKNDLVNLYQADEQKITVVYHGVEREVRAAKGRLGEIGETGQHVARSTQHAVPNLQLPARFLLAIGTIQPRKNYARLIEAYASLGLKRDEIALVIVGKPGWRADHVAVIESLAKQAGVILAGHVSVDEKAALLSNATACVLPSLYEGFGMPILEAQAAGAPVITSNTSSCPEVAGDGALLVDPTDTRAIADAMRRLLGDEALRQALIAKGRENAARFSWERCAAQTLSVLEGDRGNKGN